MTWNRVSLQKTVQEGSELSGPCCRHLRKRRKVSCKLEAQRNLVVPRKALQDGRVREEQGMRTAQHPPGLGTQCLLCPGFLPHPLSWTSPTLLDASLNHSFHFACSSVGSHCAGLGLHHLHVFGKLSRCCREAILRVALHS